MLCPRCSMVMPKGTLVCARCGELTPSPTGLPWNTRPPADGPRSSPPVHRDVPLDRRGRGVRALGPLGPVKIRPQVAPQWSQRRADDRAPRAAAPALDGAAVREAAPAPAPTHLPSAVHQAKTDPLWLRPPRSVPPPVAEEIIEEPARVPAHRRLGAFAIDAGVVALVVLLATVAALAAWGLGDAADQLERGFDFVVDGLLIGRRLGLVLLGFGVVVHLAYQTLAIGLAGTTLGKHLSGLAVVTNDDRRPSLGLAAWRAGLGGLFLVLLGGVGHALAVFDRRGLALHDRVVGTAVVEVEPGEETDSDDAVVSDDEANDDAIVT